VGSRGLPLKKRQIEKRGKNGQTVMPKQPYLKEKVKKSIRIRSKKTEKKTGGTLRSQVCGKYKGQGSTPAARKARTSYGPKKGGGGERLERGEQGGVRGTPYLMKHQHPRTKKDQPSARVDQSTKVGKPLA